MRTSIEQAKKGRFVVGVDFGTTFCSVAFAHSISPEQVKLVQSWPSYRKGTADDVPTEVYYTDPDAREYSWGYSIPQGRRQSVEPLKWFKLLIQGTPSTRKTNNQTGQKGVETFFDQIRLRHTRIAAESNSPAVKTAAQLRRLGIAPVEVIEDFLSAIKNIVYENIENTYHREFVEESKVEYVITIPAIWSDSAKALMVGAAQKAGYGQHRVDFHLLSEPEAAAAHTLKVIQPHDFKADDTFIICDAGGGTVDLISYKIQSLDPLRVDEVVTGTGDLCGSVYLDERFRLYMKMRIGNTILDNMSTLSQATMMKSWEDVKLSFGLDESGDEDDFEVHVPGVADSAELDIFEGFHTMSRKEVRQIFDPVVDQVTTLVKAQVEAVEKAGYSVSAVLLVGGFGSSVHLFEHLKAERFGGEPENVQIIQPVNARTAIARGAVLRGLDGSIVREKRARRFYGVTVRSPDIPEWALHKRIWDSIDMKWVVPGENKWYINKSDILRHSQVVSMAFRQHAAVMTPGFLLDIPIIATDQEKAPEYDWQPESEAYHVCTLSADLSSVPAWKWEVVVGQAGVEYYRLEFLINLTIENEVLKFELIHGGKSYGEVKKTDQ